jgi:hypothetical protein
MLRSPTGKYQRIRPFLSTWTSWVGSASRAKAADAYPCELNGQWSMRFQNSGRAETEISRGESISM